MDNLLVSACLLGYKCKYNGGSNSLTETHIKTLQEKYRIIPVCPEIAGGLSCPREPCERRGNRVFSVNDTDCTAQYNKGAETALILAKKFSCSVALLKEKSPSCGKNLIYDGSFTRTLTEGNGLAAEKLLDAGIKVYGESEILCLENCKNMKEV